jgi:prepilin-type N-terminal cleavage/methylation domain-containing protein
VTAAAIRRRLAAQHGYSLVEVLSVMTILGTVLTGLTTVFVGGAKAEQDLSRRFEAQQNARVALAKLRDEIHCAKSVTPAGAQSSITVTMSKLCQGGDGVNDFSVGWCVLGVSPRFALYRSAASPCNASDVRYADYLTVQNAFNYTAQSSASLAKLAVTFTVDRSTASAGGSYTLQDTLVLRNSKRTCIAGSPSPPC